MTVEIVVDFRFGDKWSVREFVTPDNPHVREFFDREVVGGRDSVSNDEVVESVARVIRDYFYYPLNIFGSPSTEAKLLRYLIIPPFWWKWRRFEPYIWQFPAETIVIGGGVCIDTANLCTSLLRVKRIDSFTVVGDVRRADTDEIVGYHAWTQTWYKGAWWIIETTIHDPKTNNMALAKDVYDRNGDFAKKTGIYYKPYFSFNEEDVIVQDMVKLTLSEKHILGKGGKKERKDLRKQEKRKQKEIWKAWAKYTGKR